MNNSQPSSARVSLSKTQLQEGAGAELFSLCQGITADGRISKTELVALGEWLNDHQNAPLPGIALLTNTLNRIIADGKVTRDEQRELMEAIEKVLPPDARKGAEKGARKAVEKKRKDSEKAAKALEQKKEQERYDRREPEDDFDFMVAGVHADGRHTIISRYLSVGDRVRLIPEPDNPHDGCAVAVTLTDGSGIGYVPRDDSADVSGCIEDCGYYVATVKKILTGGRRPIPVIVAAFYRSDQANDIADLRPDSCSNPSIVYRAMPSQPLVSSGPWWKFW